MPIDYFNTNDSDGDLGYFIGVVDDSIWSNAETESKGKATYDGADRYQLYWNGRVLEILQEDIDEDVENFTVTMGIGKDWYPEGDGDDIRHKDDPGDELVEAGRAKPILFSGATRRGSIYGKFLSLTRGGVDGYENGEGSFIVMDGGDEVDYNLIPLGRWLKRNNILDARKASIWNGHVFLFRGLGAKYNRDDKPRPKPLPVAWLGTLEDYEKSSGSSAPAREGVGEDASVGGSADAGDVANTLPSDTAPEVVETLTSLVNNSASHTEFAKTALKLPEVQGNAALTAKVMDENTGPWSAKS